MLVKMEVINQVGLLDEDYFMYGEDIDYVTELKNPVGKQFILVKGNYTL